MSKSSQNKLPNKRRGTIIYGPNATTSKEAVFNQLFDELCSKQQRSQIFSSGLRDTLTNLFEWDCEAVVRMTKYGRTPLFQAVMNDVVKNVKFLLEECCADPNQGCTENGQEGKHISPLLLASIKGYFKIVKCLVYNKAAVNGEPHDTSIPIIAACLNTRLKIVEVLLKHKADVSKKYLKGLTCLMISTHSVPLCDLLLKYGAVIDEQDGRGYTALHYAIEKQQDEAVVFLIEKGADPTMANKAGQDALHLACFSEVVPIFDYLIGKEQYTWNRKLLAYELRAFICEKTLELPTLAFQYRLSAEKIREDNIDYYQNISNCISDSSAYWDLIWEYMNAVTQRLKSIKHG